MATVRYFASLKKFKVAHYRTGRLHPGVRSVESNNLRIKKEGAPNRERFLRSPAQHSRVSVLRGNGECRLC